MTLNRSDEVAGEEPEDPVMAYAVDVVEGRVIACRLARLACERHIRDMEHGHERGLWFDHDEVAIVLTFFAFLVQRKGEWGGQFLELQPWQKFRIGSVFGWKRADGTRRFNTAYHCVARKNGKTTEAAGVGLFLLTMDGEPGAEVYCAATKKDQARICWSEAHWMAGHAMAARALKQRIRRYVARLDVPETGAKMEPLGADEDSMDGLNPHGSIFDELHAWKSRDIFGVLTTAGGARRQPLIWMITTAGNSRNSIGFEQHSYAVQVVTGKVVDDSWFVFIAEVDDPERWDDPVEWRKANPNLGVSVYEREIEQLCLKAKVSTTEKQAFLQLKCNVWVETRADPWMSIAVWDEQPVSSPLPGLEAYGGLDMASTTDLAAFALWFPDEVEEVTKEDPNGIAPPVVTRIPKGGQALWWFWLPEEGLKRREAQTGGAAIRAWVDQGWVRVCSGETIDYDQVFADIVGPEIGGKYSIRSIGRDPWNSSQIGRQIENEGYTVISIAQTIGRLNEPTKTWEKLLLDRQFRHDGNPVMRWMFGNVVLMKDRYQNVRIDREKSGDKIDGAAALVMAISEGMAPEEFYDGPLIVRSKK